MAKCPYCDKNISSINLNTVESSGLRTILYSCPHCQKVLNVQIDPVALKTDIIEAIQKIYDNK